MKAMILAGGFGTRLSEETLLDLLNGFREAGASVAGYGAAAKGNTLLNYCGITTDQVQYVVDRSPHKQGRLLPGTRIPIYPPDYLREQRPDFLIILPWNLRDEIMEQVSWIQEWGGRFVVTIPKVTVVP